MSYNTIVEKLKRENKRILLLSEKLHNLTREEQAELRGYLQLLVVYNTKHINTILKKTKPAKKRKKAKQK